MQKKTSLLIVVTLVLTALLGSFWLAEASTKVTPNERTGTVQPASSPQDDEPEIDNIEPDRGEQGQTLDVVITGDNTHFGDSSVVTFLPPAGIIVNEIQFSEETSSLAVNITILPGALVGNRDVRVVTGTEIVTEEDGFEVVDADLEEEELEGTITEVDAGASTITVATADEEDEDGLGSTVTTAQTGWTVHIDAHTRIRIEGRPAPGSIDDLQAGQQVRVEGFLQGDHAVRARKILVEQGDGDHGDGHKIGFRGVIQTISTSDSTASDSTTATLTVRMGPRTLIVVTDSNTEFEGVGGVDELGEGQWIKGEGTLQADGTLLASEIELEEHEGPGHGRVRFQGQIVDLPDDDNGLIGEWTLRSVATYTFKVTEDTRITPNYPGFTPVIGDWAKVIATRVGDALQALRVHIDRRPDHAAHPVEFRGTVESVEGNPPTEIVVDGRTVLIDERTRIEGTLDEGVVVEVKGFLQSDGSVQALRIEVEDGDNGHPEVEFKGRIRHIKGDTWNVSGITVDTAGASITGAPPRVGRIAEVQGTRRGPRAVQATEIEVEDSGDQRVVVHGTIETLPTNTDPADHTGTWTITTDDGEVQIEVTSDTVLDTRHGEIEVDALVRATTVRSTDGTLTAQRIKVFSD